jgi:GNAT superfamily N-acetyltransferase
LTDPAGATGPATPPVRPATLADVDELVRLRAVMMAALGEPDRGPWLATTAAYLRGALPARTVAAWVADDPAAAGRLVACGVGVVMQRLPGPNTGDGRIGHIASMVTEPAWRGRGLATAIVAGLLDWYRAAGVRRVFLHASESGEPIYRGLGFHEGAHPELMLDVPPG